MWNSWFAPLLNRSVALVQSSVPLPPLWHHISLNKKFRNFLVLPSYSSPQTYSWAWREGPCLSYSNFYAELSSRTVHKVFHTIASVPFSNNCSGGCKTETIQFKGAKTSHHLSTHTTAFQGGGTCFTRGECPPKISICKSGWRACHNCQSYASLVARTSIHLHSPEVPGLSCTANFPWTLRVESSCSTP